MKKRISLITPSSHVKNKKLEMFQVILFYHFSFYIPNFHNNKKKRFGMAIYCYVFYESIIWWNDNFEAWSNYKCLN